MNSTLQWLQMQDLIKKDYNKCVWIPLLSIEKVLKKGNFCYDGYEEEFFEAVAFLFSIDSKGNALKYYAGTFNSNSDSQPYRDHNDNYIRSERNICDISKEDYLEGEYLVLKQTFDYSPHKNIWHPSQDLILALKLLHRPEKDIWVLPEENYEEVMRLKRDSNAKPVCLEIKAEYLKDYLSARKSGVVLSRYHDRIKVSNNLKSLGLNEDFTKKEKRETYSWQINCLAVDEVMGLPYESEWGYMHISRTDVDYDEDIPEYGPPTDDNVAIQHKNIKIEGNKVFKAISQLWKTDWISPADNSFRVLNEKRLSRIEFIIDNQGNTAISKELIGTSRYLWFKPSLADRILSHKDASLKWHTEDTGSLGLYKRTVHFGVNQEGLINVFAKDIASLPEFDKKIWASHNCAPEGKVAPELLKSQMKARPSTTTAPEILLKIAVNELNKTWHDLYSENLFNPEKEENTILREIHRFKSQNFQGICLLAKEMNRYIIERLNLSALKNKTLNMENKIGSLKRLEQIYIDKGYDEKKLIAPLFVVNDLRKGDAHIPRSNLKDRLNVIDIDEPINIFSGKKMIHKVAENLYEMAYLLTK